MTTNALEKFQMVKIITHALCVLIYWPVRINLDRNGEIFSLPKIPGIESSLLAVAASFPVSKHRREDQYNTRPETPSALEKNPPLEHSFLQNLTKNGKEVLDGLTFLCFQLLAKFANFYK